MVWPACCQHLLGSLHWKCLVFLPFRDSEVHEEPGGKLPAAHSKIKAGAKAKALDSTAACAPRTVQFLLPCAKFPVPKDVPETPSLSGRESLLQNEAGAWRVRGLKKKKKETVHTVLELSPTNATGPQARGAYMICVCGYRCSKTEEKGIIMT